MANNSTNTAGRGRFTREFGVRFDIKGFSSAAVTAGQILTQAVLPARARIIAVVANADTAGTGAGNTVLDILQKSGAATTYTSCFTTAANRPFMLATDTGEFVCALPDPGSNTREFAQGTCIQIKVLSISTTGHAGLMFTVTFGLP